MEERQSLDEVVLGKQDSHMQISEVRTPPHPTQKLTQNGLKTNIRCDRIKLPEENIGKTFSDINHTNVFLHQSPKAIEIKNKNKQMGPSKLRSSCTAKAMIKENEKTTYRRKYLQMM